MLPRSSIATPHTSSRLGGARIDAAEENAAEENAAGCGDESADSNDDEEEADAALKRLNAVGEPPRAGESDAGDEPLPLPLPLPLPMTPRPLAACGTGPAGAGDEAVLRLPVCALPRADAADDDEDDEDDDDETAAASQRSACAANASNLTARRQRRHCTTLIGSPSG